jgi:hypothetical protein
MALLPRRVTDLVVRVIPVLVLLAQYRQFAHVSEELASVREELSIVQQHAAFAAPPDQDTVRAAPGRVTRRGLQNDPGWVDNEWRASASSHLPAALTAQRRLQGGRVHACTGQWLTDASANMMEMCCPPSPGGADPASHGRRQLQHQDCRLPQFCPSTLCAQTFIIFWRSCQSTITGTDNRAPQFAHLYDSCAQLIGFEREVEQKIGTEMKGGGSLGGRVTDYPGDAVEPLQMIHLRISEHATKQSLADDGWLYTEVCQRGGILQCAPICNATIHGYALLATFDEIHSNSSLHGSDTRFFCTLSNGMFSWVGAATNGALCVERTAAVHTWTLI